MERNRHTFATRAVRAGGGPDPETSAMIVPIHATSTCVALGHNLADPDQAPAALS